MRINEVIHTGLTSCVFKTATVGALAAAGLALAGAATAASTVYGNAQDTISGLQAQGYSVQVNGTADDPMTECTVTGVTGLSDSNVDAAGRLLDPTKFTTAHVDITCPDVH
ncbi:MAG: hypothetical protein QOD90_4730 [Mycobacterium sp.]|jgi:hypothetical protein|nr:hypothetical protein [Mycobacterium sp.]